LNWANGDSTTKTISIPIFNDGVAEPAETFTVALSSPSGVILGATSTITVTLHDPEAFPPNGTFPAGWLTSAAANAGWSVDGNDSYEGILSLKSGAIADGQKAQVEVTKLFSAGQVSFARKVSSENNWDYLRFYIDGVKQAEWSGQVAWGTVAYALSEGAHTLRWSYEKDPDCCIEGSDAAWIDAVSMPPELTPPGAPSMIGIVAGPSRATISFNAPASNGGITITGYTASCNAPGQSIRSTGGSGSPLTVYGLTPGIAYSCSVTASNSIGTSSSSASLATTPLGKPKDLSPLMMLLLD
jgi:hypothetical protein